MGLHFFNSAVIANSKIITICNFGVPTFGKYLAVLHRNPLPPPTPLLPQAYAILKLRGNPGYRRPTFFGGLGEVGHV